MAKTPSASNITNAREFIEKFGFGEINIDQFDMFIIDKGLADDPGTDDTKSIAYKGFIQQRSTARNSLNTGGVFCNGQSYQIQATEAGKRYTVVPWAVDSREIGRNIGNQIKTYTDSRMRSMKTLRNKAETLRLSHPLDSEVALTSAMLQDLTKHGIELQARIRGLVVQYNIAADMIEAESKLMLEKYEESSNVPMIENKVDNE